MPSANLCQFLDMSAIAEDISALIDQYQGQERDMRMAMARRLKGAMSDARSRAEALLLDERDGRACARRLAQVQDDIIRLLYDLARTRIYPADNLSSAEKMSIVAVGGYGRGLLAPGSDIDLLFLLPYKQTAWGESIAETLLYCLWDMGLKVGHATRSIDECLRQAKADMTIRTALLEARHICADKPLYDDLMVRFEREVMTGSTSAFVSAKLRERDERHDRAGQSRYLVEPNVKDGKGGLRDLHTLFWIGKYAYRLRARADLIEKGVFSRSEYQLFLRCENFLWTVRCHLHFLTGRPEERLSFDLQRDVAERLGYTSHPGLSAVERFMKHYFLVAKDVGDLTRIVCAELEEAEGKSVPVISALLSHFRPRRIRSFPDYPDFAVDHGRITSSHPDIFRNDPVNFIRVFALAQEYEQGFHPDIMHLMTRSLKLIDRAVREHPEANRLFLTLLSSDKNPEPILRRMNEAGVLGRFIPEFGKVVAMMQFSMYHHYTVDEHLLRCIGVLSRIERGDDPSLGLACELMASVKKRELLYVALFLHDIAKGRPEDHSVAGARIARRLCPRFGLSPADTDTVAWLISEHLTMSNVAQSRDLSDPRTIDTFARTVQSLERLKMLTILTTADISAVGPGVWNSWKSQLLRTLYFETEPLLTGGHSQIPREQRVRDAQDVLRTRLGWPDDILERYLARHYAAYWLKVDADHQLHHAHLVRKAEEEQTLFATSCRLDPERDVTEISIFAQDHPHLLAQLTGACAVMGANIVDAQIFTTVDGRALDTISLSRALADPQEELARAARIAQAMTRAVSGDLSPQDIKTAYRRIKPRHKAFSLEPEVMISNEWSQRSTVLEVSGLDRPGLLYELTSALSHLNLDITSAHVATFGEKVVDVFYLTDLMGGKITALQRQVRIRRLMIRVLEGADI